MSKDVKINLIVTSITAAIAILIGCLVDFVFKPNLYAEVSIAETLCVIVLIVHFFIWIHRVNSKDKQRYQESRLSKKNADPKFKSSLDDTYYVDYKQKNIITWVTILLMIALSLLFFVIKLNF